MVREVGFNIIQTADGNYRNGKVTDARKWADNDSDPNSSIGKDLPKPNDELRAGESWAGSAHTHQYSDGSKGNSFSADDVVTGLFGNTGKEGNFMMIEAGNTRFALVVTDVKKASKTLEYGTARGNYKKYGEGYGEGTYEQQIINAVLAVVGDGSSSGISFYMTTDPEKVSFTKVEPPKTETR